MVTPPGPTRMWLFFDACVLVGVPIARPLVCYRPSHRPISFRPILAVVQAVLAAGLVLLCLVDALELCL